MAIIRWNGGAIMAKMAAASALAVDRTMALCVQDAKDDHPIYPPASEPYERFAIRTAPGGLDDSIRIIEGARPDGLRINGQWGSLMNYALYLEIGTSRWGETAEERALQGGGNMSLIPPPLGPLMAPRPYLRPASDREYPLLATRIRQAFSGEEMV